MKFAHKIVIASAAILALSLTLLSVNQYLSVRQQVDSQVNKSVNELVQSMSRHIQEVMATKADLTHYAVSQLGEDFSDEHLGVALQDDVMYAATNELRRDAIIYSLLALLISVVA